MKLYTTRRKYKGNIFDTGLGNDIFHMTPKAQATKAKIQIELHQSKKFLHGKIINKETTYVMGKTSVSQVSNQRLILQLYKELKNKENSLI